MVNPFDKPFQSIKAITKAFTFSKLNPSTGKTSGDDISYASTEQSKRKKNQKNLYADG